MHAPRCRRCMNTDMKADKTADNRTKSSKPEQQQPQTFYGPLSGTTGVSQYQKKHSPTHIYPDHQPSFISFLHLLRFTASSLFNLCAWQSFCTTSLQVLFGIPLWNPPLHTPYISSPYHFLLLQHSLFLLSQKPEEDKKKQHMNTLASCMIKKRSVKLEK